MAWASRMWRPQNSAMCSNVSEADRVPDEPVASRQMVVHQLQGSISGGALGRHQQPLQIAQIVGGEPAHPKAQGRDVGLMAILLPEHPAQHVGMVKRFGW